MKMQKHIKTMIIRELEGADIASSKLTYSGGGTIKQQIFQEFIHF